MSLFTDNTKNLNLDNRNVPPSDAAAKNSGTVQAAEKSKEGIIILKRPRDSDRTDSDAIVQEITGPKSSKLMAFSGWVNWGVAATRTIPISTIGWREAIE